jgi:stearoyl-CoA desaturase (delta-9 desaturase)
LAKRIASGVGPVRLAPKHDVPVTEPSGESRYEKTMRTNDLAAQRQIDWLSSLPFVLVHLAPIGLLWTGVRPIDWAVCVGLYFGRMFFITGAYHRYFSHRSYKMGRVMQFLMALGGTMAVQKGVLWWAAHHRRHHKFSDQPGDVHSPKEGLLWAQVGWILCRQHNETEWRWIKDFARFPELVWLNKYHVVPPVLLAVGLYLAGGWSMLLCGFFLSTAILWHGTFSINSLMHVWGRRRYVTRDTSRNTLLLALVTMGEGWHNNHHYYQSSTNQGFFWWEIDLTYYILKMLSWVGLTWDLRKPPRHVLEGNLVRDNVDVGMLQPSSGVVADEPIVDRPAQAAAAE